jgi:hypothetical protein
MTLAESDDTVVVEGNHIRGRVAFWRGVEIIDE